MRYVIAALGIILVVLQVRLWKGDGGLMEGRQLQDEVNRQQAIVDILQNRNDTLEAEVQDLKNRLSALEERARTDLGMIRKGETFYYIRVKADSFKVVR